MSDWLKVSLRDLMPFPADAYYALLAQHTRAWLPVVFAMFALGIAAVVQAWRGRLRLAAFVFAAVWIFVGVAFHMLRYAGLSWAAKYFGMVFVLQGVLLAVDGARARSFGAPRRSGLVLALLAMLLYPLIAPLSGRPWASSETFGLMPDPTVIATIGYIVMTRRPWWLLAIPALWCLIAIATALALR